MKRDGLVWTEELFYKNFRFITKEDLFKRLTTFSAGEEINEIEVDKTYPLFRDLFGVKIEFGFLKVCKIIIRDILEILNRFVDIYPQGKGYTFQPKAELSGLIQLTQKWNMETPDEEAIQGYILNKELVQIVEDKYGYTYIRFKYKDNPENIFYIYKFFFFQFKDEIYLIIERNI